MHGICGDAREAAQELHVASESEEQETLAFPAVSAFLLRLEYEFTAAFFHGRFWLEVARRLHLTKRERSEGCTRGHLLFFKMLGYVRRMRDLIDAEKRRELAPEALCKRYAEALAFCTAAAETSPK